MLSFFVMDRWTDRLKDKAKPTCMYCIFFERVTQKFPTNMTKLQCLIIQVGTLSISCKQIMIIINLAKCSIIVENNTPYYTLFHGFLKSLNLLKQ